MKLNRKNLLLTSSAVITLTFSTPTARAQALYWDNNGNTTGFGDAGGTWAAPTVATATTGWSTDATGNTTPADATTSTATPLNFGAATGLGSGTIAISGAVSAGNITFGSFNGTAIDLSGGNLTLGANSTANTIAVGGPTRFVTIASDIVAGGVSKAGTGNLVLSGNNTFTAGTNMSAGTLRLTSANALGGSTGISITGSTSFLQLATDVAATGLPQIAHGYSSSSQGTIVSDRLNSGSAGIIYALGELNLGLTQMNFTKGTNVTGGTAGISFTNMIAGGTSATSATTLNPTTADLIILGAYTPVGTGNNTLNLIGNSTGSRIDGAISTGTRTTQGLTKAGTGTWILNGNNTYAGTTTVGNGTLVLGNSLALQNSALATTTSIAGNSTAGLRTTVTTLTLGGLNGDKNLAALFETTTGGYGNVTALTLNPGTSVTHSYAGNITDGAAGMTVAKTGNGTQVLSGTNTYTGGTTVTTGTLRPTLPSALAEYTTSNKVSFNGGTIAVVLDDSLATAWTSTQVDSLLTNANKTSGALGIDTTTGNASFAPTSLSGPIGLTKLGTNTLTLTGSNSYTGTTAVSAGTLRVGNGNALGSSSLLAIASNRLEIATDAPSSFEGNVTATNATIVSDRATSGDGVTHVLGSSTSLITLAGGTTNYLAGSNVTNTGTATIQLNGTITNNNGTPGQPVINPTTANVIIAGNVVGSTLQPGGITNLTLGGTSAGNIISGNMSNGVRPTFNVIKSNTSTWALNGVNTYSGSTTVNAGTLTLSNAASPANANVGNDASTVTISDNGTSFLNLTYFGTDVVNSLVIGANPQLPGVYGSDAIVVPGVIGIPQITGNGTLSVGLGFSSWITNSFTNGTVPLGQRGPNDDPDNDGISNLVEFAVVGQDPTVGNTTIGTFDGTTLSFSKRQPLAASLTYAIQESTDLGISVPWAAVTGTPPTYVNDGTTISYTLTPGTPAKNFLRLQVLDD